ncbi:Condensin-2 complex subunit H2 [Merluccius polli]|uniref:Condensin-2 complex subunit H2 n=1 Tax=Merluccius polli TaxID=89951 RepID=A0AA47N270_MERPO|nr:Condensin-2 complex subunit H2 [Merluccius polli]
MESTENRFAHLLQPIRELTKNWDIDVASELNDYLEELDEMCITFDGGKIKLNFAEAALLIQGSACIYSKKVELLYSLVYQTMDYINHKNNKRDKQAGASDKEDADGKATDDDNDGDFMFKPLESSTSEESKDFDSTTSVHVVPLPPESLILPETHEKQKLPLISMKGEVLGSHKDFRINTFMPGAQDLILLSLGMALSKAVGAIDTGSHHSFGQPSQHPVDMGEAPEPPENHVANGDDGGDDFMPLQDNGMEMDHTPEEHIERQQAPSEGRVLRERRDVQPAEKDAEQLQTGQQERANMWQLHNLYDVFGEDQPLKTGKCYKVPGGLDDGGKRKRKQPSALQDFRSWFTGVYLNYIYLSKVKDKVKTRKRINRKAGVVVSEEELRRTFLQPDVGAMRGQEGNPEENRHPDLQGGDDDLSDNEHEPLLDDIPAEFGGGHDFIMPGSQGEELSYEDLVKKSVEQFLVNSKGYAQETALSRRVKNWEDKIRPGLALQEEQPTFDIHNYSDRIVGALGAVGHQRSFASLVHGLDNFEACKYMLASLQLANDYTVEVHSEAGLEESVDTMSLTLLSTHRATERFKALGSI